ncbi:MAG TPA: hypothetical protein VHV08_08535, partial [Pirellulales bacterium]|nr:hypothetical protein [Pirellulales bacterium]
SGELLVKDPWVIHRWHKESCRDTAGLARHCIGGDVTVGGPDHPNTNSSDDDGAVYHWRVD